MNDKNKGNDKELLELNIKILVIGDSSVGKTSLLLNYIDGTFSDDHMNTIGVEYKEKNIIKNGFNVRLQLWDTAGEERFRSITKTIYRNTNGVVYVYDITSFDSFKNVKNWIKDTQNIDNEIKGIIVGNKIDLENQRAVSKQDLEEFGKSFNFPVLEASAKTGTNVDKCFEMLLDEFFKNKTEEDIKQNYLRKRKYTLSESTKKMPKKKCCK